MATSQCTTQGLAWCSPEFFKEKLDKLCENNIVEWYIAIPHIGEYDAMLEKRDKDHIHFCFKPVGRIDLDGLKGTLTEVGLDGSSNSAGMFSKEKSVADFIAYGLHNDDYLRKHHMKKYHTFQGYEPKEYEYTYDNFIYNDSSIFAEYCKEARMLCFPSDDCVIFDALANGVSPTDLLVKGIPIFKITSALTSLDKLARMRTDYSYDKMKQWCDRLDHENDRLQQINEDLTRQVNVEHNLYREALGMSPLEDRPE